MPTSQKDQIPHIISVVQQVRPASVLDLGLGFGKYGFLLREYLDVATSMGLLPPPETTEGTNGGPKVCIDGVEGCSTYVGELQHEVYDRIIEMNILDACKTLSSGSYDCCLLVDVLEHLTPAEGWELLSQIRRISRSAVVSTPKRFYAQGDVCGNPLERHVSVWTRRQLAAAGFDVYWPRKESHIAVHAASTNLRSTLRRYIRRSRCKELTPIVVYDAYQRLRYGGVHADSC